MKVSIDRSGCIGCVICEIISPQIFRMDAEGLAEVIAQPTSNLEAGVAMAAAECPVAVIRIEE